MSPPRIALSCLILFHVLAIGVNAIPSPDELNAGDSFEPPKADALALSVAPALDTAVRWLAPVERRLYDVCRPVRALTRAYIEAGLRQRWDMFSRPETDSHYVRLGYYVASPGALRPRVVLELVFPADREDRVRVLHDYQDKAVVIAFEGFFSARAKQLGEPAISNQLLPLTRYFKRRYARGYLAPDETIVRTDVWYGSAPMPSRGERTSDRAAEARLDVLRNYYDGPVPAINRRLELPRVSSREREADIVWVLATIDEH
jgi:hypothetical protein